MVTADGFAKVLDFGLARLAMREAEADFATRTAAADTKPGTVLGTLAYMSPEQASGAVVDFRSDQFSFGAVLYEMLTGQRAFAKPSSVDTLSAVLRDDPTPIGTAQSGDPRARPLDRRAHGGEAAANRYASTRDLARDLANARDHLSEMSSRQVRSHRADPTPARSTMTTRERLAWAVAAVMAIAASVVGDLSAASRPEPVRSSVRFQLAPPENVSIEASNQCAVRTLTRRAASRPARRGSLRHAGASGSARWTR